MKIIVFTLSIIAIVSYQANAQLEVKDEVKMKYFIEGGIQSNSRNTDQLFVGGGFERSLNNRLSWRGSATLLNKFDNYSDFGLGKRRSYLLELGISTKLDFAKNKKWFVEGGLILRRHIWQSSIVINTSSNNDSGLQFGIGYQTLLKEGNRVTIGGFLKYFNQREGLLGGIKLGYYF
jgi:hypothetical protein